MPTKRFTHAIRIRRNTRRTTNRCNSGCRNSTNERRSESNGTEYFIIYHPALTYYARDYGLRQEAIETDGKEPSARHLSGIIREARAKGIRKILYQSQFPASAVETVARDIGAEAVRIDPLREDVTANIDEITEQLTSR